MLQGRKIRGLYRLGVVSKQGELLSDTGPVVLSRRMDKRKNHYTKAYEASARVLGGLRVV